tara:strand:- start:7538 stop:8728 length:1191 start_codon:yes stop_codon:yes gene_type:complete
MIENLKKDCSKRFSSHGYPTRKEENWKFTSSRNLAKFENDVLQKPKIDHLDIDNNTILFVNGILDQRTLKNFKYNEKLKVVDLSILKEKSTLKFSENFIKDSVFNLGVMDFKEGFYFEFDKNLVLDEPIKLVNYYNANKDFSRITSFNIFHVQSGSEISFIENDINDGESSFNLKLNKFISEKNSVLKFSKFYQGKGDNHLLSYNYFTLKKDSILKIDALNKESIFNKEFIEVDLEETGCDVNISILNLGKKNDHLDNNILINHNAESCTSFQHVRNILDNDSSAVFNGKVIVSEGAQKTDSNQSNKNLLLSDTSNAYSNPQLEIYADDVSCGHGSTTGALNEDSIFYLRARGIKKSDAIKILIKAFAKEVIDEFSLSSIQDISEIALDNWINEKH